IHPDISPTLQNTPGINQMAANRTEAAILIIGFIYLAAAACNLLIPKTHVHYPQQKTNPFALIHDFKGYVCVLWQDKLGQISLAVTTLFWGAGATLQFIVIEWGAQQLGYRLDQASI